ncbi:MAG: undecaprenyl-diphosphate phosphatase [Armatimonadota bacterium]|jgi:undecaprenyl-diphosphatase
MHPLKAAILGLVQGATEFLPVSSSGHLVVAGHLLEPDAGADEGSWAALVVLLHLGTLAAVVVYYRQDLWAMARAVTHLRSSPTHGREAASARRLLWLILLGTVPAAVAGLAFKGPIERLLAPEHVGHVGTFLWVSGGLVYLAARAQGREARPENIAFRDAVLIGVAQACALMPGISRSGATIAVGRACGLSEDAAPRLAFLLSVPAILGGTIVELDALAGLQASDLAGYVVGFAVAAVSGLAAIHTVIRTLRQRRFYVFAVYCWLLGSVLLLAELL